MSLLSALSKIIEKNMLNQLTYYFISLTICFVTTSGFRYKHLTELAAHHELTSHANKRLMLSSWIYILTVTA